MIVECCMCGIDVDSDEQEQYLTVCSYECRDRYEVLYAYLEVQFGMGDGAWTTMH